MSVAAASSRDIRVSRGIKASPKRIYRALTSARELCLWWLERAETDARNLGRLRMVWPEALGWGEAEGLFVDLEPESKVAWLWGGRGIARGVPRLVSLFIERHKSVSSVTIVHAGFSAAGDGPDGRDAYRARWQDCLEKLALHLEKGRSRKGELLKPVAKRRKAAAR